MDVSDKLDDLVALIEGARAVPMSGSCVVNRVEVLALLEDVRELLPEELRYAELLLRDREAVVEEGRQEARRLLADAEEQRAARIAEQEVVLAAAREAEELLADAGERAATLRREADDYVDAKLESFEVLLHRTLAGVHRGRERLRAGSGAERATGSQRDPEPGYERDPGPEYEHGVTGHGPSGGYDSVR